MCSWILFHFLGVHEVLGTTFSRNFSLVESCREFVRRYKESETNKTSFPMLASACPGIANYGYKWIDTKEYKQMTLF